MQPSWRDSECTNPGVTEVHVPRQCGCMVPVSGIHYLAGTLLGSYSLGPARCMCAGLFWLLLISRQSQKLSMMLEAPKLHSMRIAQWGSLPTTLAVLAVHAETFSRDALANQIVPVHLGST